MFLAKFKLVLSVFLSLIIVSSCATSIKTVKKQGFEPEKCKKVAVLPFQGTDPQVNTALAEAFITEAMDIGFDVIERSRMESVFNEHKISLSGIIDEQTIIKVGKIMGVNAIVLGSYQMEKVKLTPRQVRIARNRAPIFLKRAAAAEALHEMQVVFRGINIRFVNVETGETLISSSVKKDIMADEITGCLSNIAESIKKKLKEK